MIINKSLAKVYTDIAGVQSDTDDLQTQIGVAGVGLSAIPDMALDSTVAKASVLGSAVGASISADIAAIKSVVDLCAIASVVTSAFGVTDGKVDAVDVLVDTAITDIAACEAKVDTAISDIGTVDTVVDGIVTDVGDPSGDTLISLSAKMGDDAKTVKARFDDVDTAIAAIDPGTSGENAGNFNYLDAGAEQTIIELTITDRKIIQGAWLDLFNMTQNGTIKCYYKVDGTNYREFSSEAFTVATDSDGVYIDLNMGVSQDFKLTYTEGADEGGDRVMPYAIIWQAIE